MLRIYIVNLEEGCSKTDMEVTGISLQCVVRVNPSSIQELPSPNCIRHYLLETESHRLVPSHQKRHKTAFHFPAMVSFLFISTKLGSISSLAQPSLSFQTFQNISRACSTLTFDRLIQYLCCASFCLDNACQKCQLDKFYVLRPRFF